MLHVFLSFAFLFHPLFSFLVSVLVFHFSSFPNVFDQIGLDCLRYGLRSFDFVMKTKSV